MKKLLCFVILLPFIFCMSCAQMSTLGNEEIFGAGSGAVAGGIVGQLIGKSTESTLIGAAVGGLLGFAVGKTIKTKTSQVYNQQQTEQLIAKEDNTKRVVRINSESVEPSMQFRAGDNVTIRIRYILMDPQLNEVVVREKKTLWYRGNQQTVFEDTTINRENGTWESLITFQLPNDVQKGMYEVHQDIYSGQATDSSLVYFTVI